MYQFFVEHNQINESEKKAIILGQDVNHIKNVLRMKIGEEVNLSDGVDGKEYHCKISSLSNDRIELDLLEINEGLAELPVSITLYQGLPKAEKMEFIIQKCVELGVSRIVPVSMKRCIVKLDDKKADSKIQRWQGIAEAAAKQSKRDIIPRIEKCMTYKEAIKEASSMEVKLLPFEHSEGMDRTRKLMGEIKPGDKVAIFIGPEGGFEDEEVEYAFNEGINPITLGNRILRTETAGMTTVSWIAFLLG